MNLMELTARLLAACEQNSVRLKIEYDTGRHIPGEFFDPKNPDDPTHVVQGPSGWNVEVDLRAEVDENGDEMLYPTIGDAIIAGANMLTLTLGERAEGAKRE